MRLGIKILFISIAFLAFIFTAAHIFLVVKGQALIIKKLHAITNRKVSIGRFAINSLLKIEINDLDIEGMGHIEYMLLTPSIIGLISGDTAFNTVQITKPEFTFERFPVEEKKSSAVSPKHESLPVVVLGPKVMVTPAQIKRLKLVLKDVSVNDGRINFIDHTAGESGIKIVFKEVNLKLHNLRLIPHSANTDFSFSARIPWAKETEEGKVNVAGWINFFKREMKVTVNIQDIDGIYLYPYYSTWVDLDKAKIEKAKLNFTSDILGVNNNLTAQCHLELTDIVRKKRPPEESEGKDERITSTVIDVFKALDKGKIVLDFTIRTKMDRPELGFADIKMAFQDKLAVGLQGNKIGVEDVMMFPKHIIEGTVKGATDISSAFVDGTMALGLELKKAFQAAFKKEKKVLP